MAQLSEVTLIIPNRNEPQWWATYRRLRDTLGDQVVIDIVDDPRGRGVGATLRIGVDRATTPYVLFVMADGSEHPASLLEMIRPAACVPLIVWGDRWRRGTARIYTPSVVGYPLLKRLGNRLGNTLINLWLRPRGGYTDWTDLAKCYRTEVLQDLTWSSDFRCAVEIPIRYWRARGRPRILTIPMHWRERSLGRSSYSLGQALKVFWATLKVLYAG